MNGAPNESTSKTPDIEAYAHLLNRSVEDIVKESRQLRASIRQQRELIDEWVISQEAFRNLTLQFRQQLGISDEETSRMCREEHAAVLAKHQEKENIT